MPSLNEKTKSRITIVAGWVNKVFAYKFLKKLPFNAKALIIVLACSLLLYFGMFIISEMITAIVKVIFYCYTSLCEIFISGANQFIAARGKRAFFVYTSVGLILYYAIAPLLLRVVYSLIRSVKQSLFCEDTEF